MRNLEEIIIKESNSILDALIKIDINNKKFLIALNEDNKVIGILTDGNIRRAIISGLSVNEKIQIESDYKYLSFHDDFKTVSDLFKLKKIDFLPIINESNKLVNFITRKEFHLFLLHDYEWSAGLDFSIFDVDSDEIVNCPWGFYKSTMLCNYAQSKIITIYPGEQLSLQSHTKREEHWVVLKGHGIVILDTSSLDVYPGRYVHVPLNSKHQIINNSKENITLSEVQLGDYFGEDDITRYEDKYGRK